MAFTGPHFVRTWYWTLIFQTTKFGMRSPFYSLLSGHIRKDKLMMWWCPSLYRQNMPLFVTFLVHSQVSLWMQFLTFVKVIASDNSLFWTFLGSYYTFTCNIVWLVFNQNICSHISPKVASEKCDSSVTFRVRGSKCQSSGSHCYAVGVCKPGEGKWKNRSVSSKATRKAELFVKNIAMYIVIIK
jgi:hypothetical protein